MTFSHTPDPDLPGLPRLNVGSIVGGRGRNHELRGAYEIEFPPLLHRGLGRCVYGPLGGYTDYHDRGAEQVFPFRRPGTV